MVGGDERVEVLFGELRELAGQRNGIDGRIVEIVAELDRDGLCGATGARSMAELVAWKLGASSMNAHTIATIAHRWAEFPLCAQGMREGRLSLDQVGVIAAGAAEGSDAHYAELARVASVSQLRTAVKLEPRPEPEPEPSLSRGPIPSRRSRSPRPPMSSTPITGSPCRIWRRRSSTRPWPRIVMRWRRSGNSITTTAPTSPGSGRRDRAPGRRLCGWSTPAGTPRPPAARTGSTPRWWYTST